MKTNITLRTREITTVTNTIMTTATSIRLLGTISNTISLLDRTREVNSLELSRDKVDSRKRGVHRPALVVNLVTLSLMIWIIEIFIRMHPRTIITAVCQQNSQVILTYIGQFKLHLILEMLLNRQRPQVECKMTKLPNFPPLIPCWDLIMRIRIENQRHHLRQTMLAWSKWVGHVWVRRAITITMRSRI